MAKTPVPGYGWKVYENTGTAATPAWALIPDTRDVSVPFALDELDDSSRDSAFKKFLAGMAELDVEFGFRYRNGSAAHAALIAKITGRTVFQIAVVDGDIGTSGTEGWKMYCQLFTHNLTMPLADNTGVEVTAKQAFFEEADVEIDAEWMTIP